MSELGVQIQHIQEKLQQLLEQLQHVKKENTQLKKEIEQYQAQMIAKDKQMQSIQQQADIVRLDSSNWTFEEKREMEKRINTYLKEIDKCLSLLNN